jgi:hypothetical protein
MRRDIRGAPSPCRWRAIPWLRQFSGLSGDAVTGGSSHRAAAEGERRPRSCEKAWRMTDALCTAAPPAGAWLRPLWLAGDRPSLTAKLVPSLSGCRAFVLTGRPSRRAISVPSTPDSHGSLRSPRVTLVILTCARSSIGMGQHEWYGCARSPPGTILPCPADRCGPWRPRDRERRTASATGRDRSNPACPPGALANGRERSTAVNLGSCRPGPGLAIRLRPGPPSPADRASQARSVGTRAALRTAGHAEQPSCDDRFDTTKQP